MEPGFLIVGPSLEVLVLRRWEWGLADWWGQLERGPGLFLPVEPLLGGLGAVAFL
jgi:hypothetical protein